jgi:hypothetical protein
MEKTGTVSFVVITLAAFILIGIFFVSFSGKGTATSKATYTEKICYLKDGEGLYNLKMEECCFEIKNSEGCKNYENDLLICGDVVVSKNTVEDCQK